MRQKWRKPLALLLAVLLLCMNGMSALAAENAEAMPTIGISQPVNGGIPDGSPLPPDGIDSDSGLCPHHGQHTEACGYTEDGAGTPCAYDCVICKIQERIDALPEPEAIAGADEEQLTEQLNAIRQDLAGLSPEDAALVDISRLEALTAALGGPKRSSGRIGEDSVAALEVQGEPTEYFATAREAFDAADGSGKATVRLLKDAELTGDTAVAITSEIILEAGEFTLSGSGGTAFGNPETMFILYEGGDFTLKSGAICSTASSYVFSVRGGTFRMEGGTVESDAAYGQYVLYVVDSTANAADSKKTTSAVKLTGGTIDTPGKSVAISGEGSSAEFSGCDLTVYGVNLGSGASLDISDGSILAKGYTALSVSDTFGQNTRLRISGGTITIDNPSTSTGLGLRCLYVQEKSADVQLSGGTFYNKRDYAVYTRDSTIISGILSSNLNQLLAKGYCYNQNGAWLSEDEVNALDKLVGTVKVGKPPITITEQPAADASIFYGSDESLQVTAERSDDAADPVTYQWFCRPKAEQDFQPVEGAVSDTLSLKEADVGEYEYYCLVQCGDYTIISQTAAVSVAKARPYITGIPAAASIIYGGTLDGIALTGCTAQRSETDSTTVPGSFAWREPDVKPGVADSLATGYVVVFTPDDTANYEPVETSVKLAVTPKPLTVSGATAANRAYDGTNRVTITSVTLDGRVDGDGVSVQTAGLNGVISGSDAGRYTGVTLPALTLTGPAAANYSLTQPTAPVNAQLTISKAAALLSKPGDLAVANDQAHSYTYGLGALRPDVPEGMSLGSNAVTYELGPIDLGGYYAGGAVVDGQTLTLPIQPVDSKDVKEIGTVTVIIHSDNFEDMTAAIRVRSVNKILPEGKPNLSAASIAYGQPIGTITLSGAMWDTVNNKEVPGVFAWSNPDNRPAVQEKYAAAWTFIPEDNLTYAMVTGTSFIQVLSVPASQYMVNLSVSPAEGGTAAGGGIYEAGQPVTVKAVPAEGYLFEGWNENGVIVSASAEYTFTPTGHRNLTAVFSMITQSEIEVRVNGLTEVPDGLKGTPFDTVEKITAGLRTKVTAALSGVGSQIAVYDVRLQYLEDGVWKDVDPDNFPAEGVTAILPYPEGTNGSNYVFTIQHMVSHGPNAGTIETLRYASTSLGLQCRFTSLSPVAVGYKAIETKPSGEDSGSESEDWDDESAFWKEVIRTIETARPGDRVKVNARGYDRMPWTVMDALRKNDGIRLIIRWNGGEEIVIPAKEALNESLRIYYPLSYLADYDFERSDAAGIPSKLNPETGGVWEVNAPVAAEVPLALAGTPEVTPSQWGLAETPELARKGIERAVPDYETKAVSLPAETRVPGGRSSLPMIPFLLLAAVSGGIRLWKNRLNNQQG